MEKILSMSRTRRDILAGLIAGGAAWAAAPPLSLAAQTSTDLPISSGRIEVPGGRVWWQKYGDGPKTPLLLLHGGPGAAHNYLLPLRALADERPVIFYDQLGCGLSDAPPQDGPYHIARFVQEVDAVRKVLGLDRVILYGHSWGSMLAIEYLVTGHGAGVEKLILAGAMASIPQMVVGMRRLITALPDGAGERLAALEASGQTSTPEYGKIVQLFYDRHLLRTKPTPDFEASIASLGKSPAYAIMNGPNEFTITGNIKNWERRKDLGAIKLPTLITTGQYDEVTLDCHETIRDGIAGSRLHVIPDCSHLTMQEAPDAYTALLRPFL
jgi:proline iminopeptidase